MYLERYCFLVILKYSIFSSKQLHCAAWLSDRYELTFLNGLRSNALPRGDNEI